MKRFLFFSRARLWNVTLSHCLEDSRPRAIVQYIKQPLLKAEDRNLKGSVRSSVDARLPKLLTGVMTVQRKESILTLLNYYALICYRTTERESLPSINHKQKQTPRLLQNIVGHLPALLKILNLFYNTFCLWIFERRTSFVTACLISVKFIYSRRRKNRSVGTSILFWLKRKISC